jgi:hypothetical protein
MCGIIPRDYVYCYRSRRGRTANCAQYRDNYDIKLNVTHTPIMVKVAELAFQTLLSTFKKPVTQSFVRLDIISMSLIWPNFKLPVNPLTDSIQ